MDYDGTTVLKEETVNWNTNATPPSDPTRDGYHFTGWSVAYTSVKDNLTVTAQYAINTYTVKFVDFNGAELKTQTVDWNTNATAPANPSRTGYDFTGWDTAFTNVKTDLTVTAKYAIQRFVVSFYVGDHGSLSIVSPYELVQVVDYGSSANAPTIDPDAGYTLSGWDKAFDNVTQDLDVTAQYTQQRFRLSVNVQGNGTVTGLAGRYDYNADVDLTDATVTPDTGYRFDGFTDTNGNAITVVTMTRNRTVNALFSAIPPAPSASPSPSPSVNASPSPSTTTEQIQETQMPEAAPAASQGQATGFSLYWLILIIGLPLIALILLLFFIWRKKKDEAKTNV